MPHVAMVPLTVHEGRMLADRDWSFYTLFDVTYQPDVLTVLELEQGFRDAVRQVFSNSACQRRAAIRERVWGHRFEAVTTS